MLVVTLFFSYLFIFYCGILIVVNSLYDMEEVEYEGKICGYK